MPAPVGQRTTVLADPHTRGLEVRVIQVPEGHVMQVQAALPTEVPVGPHTMVLVGQPIRALVDRVTRALVGQHITVRVGHVIRALEERLKTALPYASNGHSLMAI